NNDPQVIFTANYWLKLSIEARMKAKDIQDKRLEPLNDAMRAMDCDPNAPRTQKTAAPPDPDANLSDWTRDMLKKMKQEDPDGYVQFRKKNNLPPDPTMPGPTGTTTSTTTTVTPTNCPPGQRPVASPSPAAAPARPSPSPTASPVRPSPRPSPSVQS